MIDIGDKVSHRTKDEYNGLLMTVKDIEEYKAYCEYYEYSTKELKDNWFNFEDLDIRVKNDGGFL